MAAEDTAIFPLAIPLLSGPGAIATILLLTSQASGYIGRFVALALVVVLVYGVALVTLDGAYWRGQIAYRYARYGHYPSGARCAGYP